MKSQIERSLKIAQQLFPETYVKGRYRQYHFAFIFRRNRLLSIGTNSMYPQDIKALKLNQHLGIKVEFNKRCAETDAINRLWGKVWIDGNVKMVILRLNRFGLLQESKPCRVCASILNALDITDIAYSTRAGDIVIAKNHN